MNALQIFNYNDKPIRTIDRDGVLWLAAEDFVSILGAAESLPLTLDEISICSTDKQEAPFLIVNEAGLFRMIRASSSAEAEDFKHWVMHVMLPEFSRKVALKAMMERIINDPDYAIQLLSSLKAKQESSGTRYFTSEVVYE